MAEQRRWRATPESSSSGATQPVHFAPTQESGSSSKVKLSPRAPESSTSGAVQPAAPLPEDPEAERIRRIERSDALCASCGPTAMREKLRRLKKRRDVMAALLSLPPAECRNRQAEPTKPPLIGRRNLMAALLSPPLMQVSDL